ncbi:MAG: amino acid adenylation domain-containing protein, partial [Lachnospiraceae bacterium]|nr:amino acid adenylation domain-containing protein [Lachnospiraceae bacterium]
MPDIMKALNDTYFDASFEPVASMFERQAQFSPDKPAVVSTALSFTYRELNRRSNSIANSLLELGIAADDTVMLFLERSALVYAANIGILKAGAAFVYAPPSYPEERARYIFRDAACRYLITSRETDPEKLNAILGKDERPLYIEELLEHNNTADPHAGIKAHDLAYCIYTSGSTGKPKGVMIEEDNLFNFLHHNPKNTETACIAENSSVLLANAALTFDVSIMEEFIPLTSGGTVAFASDAEILNPLLLKEFIQKNRVDGICITPSFLNTLISLPAMKEALKNIRVYDIGAEAFPGSLFAKIRLISPNALILNGYGPTETTISCTVKMLESGENISIGKPNANVSCYIVDKDNNECAAGEVGELLIAGRGVGRGYKNLPEKTAEAFIEFKGMRSYKTGDLARITPDGEIEFHGRRDSQVKLRGLRIELGEIEESMSGFDGIDSCAAA